MRWRRMLPMGNREWSSRVSAVSAPAAGCDQLDEHAAGVLGVDEVDPAVGRAALGDVVEQPQAALAQRGADRLDVVDPEGQLLQARARSGR